MNNIHHLIIDWSSALIFLIMGILLIVVSIPKTERWNQLRKTRLFLIYSFFVLGIFTLIKSIVNLKNVYFNHIEIYFLVITFSQLFVFENSALSFIKCPTITYKKLMGQIGLIIGLLTTLELVCCEFPAFYGSILILTTVGYFILAILSIRNFHKVFNNEFACSKQIHVGMRAIEAKWIKTFYYLSVGVTITALVAGLISKYICNDNLFILCYALYLVTVIISMIKFLRVEPNKSAQTNMNEKRQSGNPSESVVSSGLSSDKRLTELTKVEDKTGKRISSAMSHALQHAEAIRKVQQAKEKELEEIKELENDKNEKNTPITTEDQELEEALDKWVNQEKFLDPNLTIQEVAAELGTTIGILNMHFIQHKNMLFRTWRMKLRIEKARNILTEFPDTKISDLYQQVGFSDKSHFFRQFKEFTGMTPNKYKKQFTQD